MVKVWVSLKTILRILGYGVFRLSSPNFMNLSKRNILKFFRFNQSGVYKSDCSDEDEDVLTAAMALNR